MNTNLNKQVEETFTSINSATELLSTLKKCNEEAIVSCANQKLQEQENGLSYIVDLVNICGGGDKLSKLTNRSYLLGEYNGMYLKYYLKNQHFSVRPNNKINSCALMATFNRNYVQFGNSGEDTFDYEDIIKGFETIDRIEDIALAGENLVKDLLESLTEVNNDLLKQINKYQKDFQRFIGNNIGIQKILYDVVKNSKEIDDISLEQQGIAIWKNGKKYTISTREEKTSN